MAPATPTGLHVDTTETSIEWHWNAVEGAIGYAVQISMDEMFDATDTIAPTAENHYTVSDLEPMTSVYLRVAAAAGTLEAPILSAWSTHVTGMSAMPPPPPTPAPEPVMASFMVPDDAKKMYPMIPDGMTDKDKAMASVNSEIMVTANTTAVVVPMWIEEANPVKLHEGDNTPFTYVDWMATQKMVVEEGVTFKVMRVTVGANQEMEPTGDVAYVTCGPFECETGMDAPEIGIHNSAVCNGWDPMMELHVGLIDNDGEAHGGVGNYAPVDATTTIRVFDGLDLGWTYKSNEAFHVEHDLAVVSHTDRNVAKSSSYKPLKMTSIGAVQIGRTGDDNLQTYFGLAAQGDLSIDPDTGATRDTTLVPGACQPLEHTDLWDYNDNLASRVSKPDNCFRITVDKGLERDYLDNYSVELTLAAAQLTWGSIAWDAFKGHKCDTVPVDTGVPVCDMFADEVNNLPNPKTVAVAQLISTGPSQASDNVTGVTLAGFNLMYEDAGMNRYRFTAMPYLDATTTSKTDTLDLYDAVPSTIDDDTDSSDDTNAKTGSTIGTTTDHVIGAGGAVWIPTLDDDYDPMYGDLGKVDITLEGGTDSGADGKADNFADDDDSNDCKAGDGGVGATGTGGADNNSTLCDAEVEIPAMVTFTDGLGLGCDMTVEYTLTCNWNSRGNAKGTIGPRTAPAGSADLADFVSCTVEKN